MKIQTRTNSAGAFTQSSTNAPRLDSTKLPRKTRSPMPSVIFADTSICQNFLFPKPIRSIKKERPGLVPMVRSLGLDEVVTRKSLPKRTQVVLRKSDRS